MNVVYLEANSFYPFRSRICAHVLQIEEVLAYSWFFFFLHPIPLLRVVSSQAVGHRRVYLLVKKGVAIFIYNEEF